MSSPPSSLTPAERRTLLETARLAIREAVLHRRLPDLPEAEGALGRRGGVFVTLNREGRLRGCIGLLEGGASLVDGVARCAIAAALDDPRFEPVQAEELGLLELEISLLSPLAPIRPEEVEVGRHGLLVRRGTQRGLLLPQVAAEHHWTRETFLDETCHKAGLERKAWLEPDTSIEAFTAEVFSDRDAARAASD